MFTALRAHDLFLKEAKSFTYLGESVRRSFWKKCQALNRIAADDLGSLSACSVALTVFLHEVHQAENGAVRDTDSSYEQGNGGLWKEATLQGPVLVMALCKMLLVQHHLVEGGRFGKGVTNNTARLEFAAICRACYERAEIIYMDFEQLDLWSCYRAGLFLTEGKTLCRKDEKLC